MWFDVDWHQLAQTIAPSWWRKPRFVALMRAFLKPLEQLHNQVKAYRAQTVYELTFTGQTFSLEVALNDRFDALNRAIWIENIDDPTELYIYRIAEAQPPLHIYRKWDAAIAYSVGHFALYLGNVWKCSTAHTNETPGIGSSFWDFEKAHSPYLKRKEESQQTWDFIVWVPIILVFDTNEMRALVDRYRIAPKRYTIQTF